MVDTSIGLDVFFLLMGAILVFSMHGGFAFLELGTVRGKNQVNAMVKIIVDFAFSTLAYFFVVGTSSAAPHVSGLAAMLVQQGITNPIAIEAALERFATDIGTPGRDFFFGFGLVDARSTLRGLGLAR